jgi:hypothetical protein
MTLFEPCTCPVFSPTAVVRWGEICAACRDERLLGPDDPAPYWFQNNAPREGGWFRRREEANARAAWSALASFAWFHDPKTPVPTWEGLPSEARWAVEQVIIHMGLTSGAWPRSDEERKRCGYARGQTALSAILTTPAFPWTFPYTKGTPWADVSVRDQAALELFESVVATFGNAVHFR